MDLRPGNTPIIFLSGYIASKMESKNPSGSIKDRITEWTLNSLKKDGKISMSSELISILNGEFAVSFAYFCAKKGYKCNIVCPETINKNHLNLCKMFGAEMHLVELTNYKDFLSMKDEVSENKKLVFIDFYEKEIVKELYKASFCKELKIQLQSTNKNIKNIFLFSESGILAQSLKEEFPNVSIYNVEIKNAFFNFNGNKRDIVNNLNVFSDTEFDKNLFDKEISIKLDYVTKNIKEVSKKSGLLMDYRTSACYLAAKEYICFNNDVNLIIFYENGERYIEEIFSL